jgi:hypothetical protein
MMYPTFFEALDRRQYLAGITLIMPAWDSGLTNFLDTTITAITADLGGPQNVPQYVLTLAPTQTNGPLVITGVTHVAGTPTPQVANLGQIIVTIDYTSVSSNMDYPLSTVASLVTNYMETTPVDGVLWASLPIHEISTSRGSGLEDALTQSFDESGLWVNQETYLDPHPITDPPFNDLPSTVFDNVEFADDYWRSSGEDTDTDPAGHPVAGAYNEELTWVQANYSTFALAHLAPPAYYIGTIDPSLIGTSDGQGTIQPSWYGNGSTPTTLPAPDQTGFLYSLIGGGTRPTSGLWAASGGTGVRTAVTHTGQQWPNVSDVDPTATTAQSDTSLDIDYLHEDQGEADTITFSLDSNQNPYDTTGIAIGTQSGIASSTAINNGSYDASLRNVTPGTYYLCAEVTDTSGLARYYYSQQQVTITNAPPPITVTTNAHSNPAIVTSTTTHLLALATDLAGDKLTYTWRFTHLPAGAHSPMLIHNGTSELGVIFYKQGGYSFTCTITDTAGNSITSSGSLDVVSTATRLDVTSLHATVRRGTARVFSVAPVNQFGHTFDPANGPQFSLVNGPATITSNGIFNAGETAGSALINVEDDGMNEMFGVEVVY